MTAEMYRCVQLCAIIVVGAIGKKSASPGPPMESVQGMLPDRHLPKFKIRVIKMEDW